DLGMHYQVVQGMKFLMVIATGPGTAMAPPGPDTAMTPPGPGTGQWKVGTPIASGCVPEKVLDRLFTNALMVTFNMKEKGKQGKRSLEKTKVYGAIKDGIMTGDEAATEDIRIHAAEHLKHAPQRSGGHKAITQD
ncbi:hypothetical protein AMECASPLE_038478, partial [Ameca splendens]